MKKMCFIFLLILNSFFLQAEERADIIVAKDGSGDFTSIQTAINSIPGNNSKLKIILIKNGTYEEEIRIDADHIALVGEDRDSTRIEFYKPYVWDSTYVEFGRAIINIYADDITLANLTAENTQPEVGIHAFTVYGTDNTRTIIINCNILSNGGDTVSLWNGYTGMYYHNTCYFKGAVDFLCPRGWCYAENIDFYCTRTTTPLWHDGSKNKDQKFVVKNATFDGEKSFDLGRNHYDGAFYLINHVYSDKLNNKMFTLPSSADEPYKWGERYYFHNCQRPSGNYDWFKDNLMTAENSPMPEEVTPLWTFDGKWDPEATMPSVLEFAFLPKPDHNAIRVDTEPTLTWVAGRNAIGHNIYFGTDDPPAMASTTNEAQYMPGKLQPNTVYHWRVDEVTSDDIITGEVWSFRTESDVAPQKAMSPAPENEAEDVAAPIERLEWQADSLVTDLYKLYLGSHPDSLELISSYSAPYYILPPLHYNKTYYWRVDQLNHAGETLGDVWQFSMESSGYNWEHFLQDESGMICMEAEDCSRNVNIGYHTWELVTDPAGYSGDGAMQVLPDSGYSTNFKYPERCSHLDYAVKFLQSGTHYVWVRAYSQNDNDDVFHVGLNGEESRDAYRMDDFESQNQWQWLSKWARMDARRVLNVKALGVQVFNLYFGKDGCIADKIIITSDSDYVPEGLGPDVTVDVSDPENIQQNSLFHLFQNYPNPFNPMTSIAFALPESGHVLLNVFDVTGKHVKTLVNGKISAGTHEVEFDATSFASGVYIYKVKYDSQTITKRMLLVR